MNDVEIPSPEEVAELRKNRFTKVVALTVACYAVILAFSSLGGSHAGSDQMMSQMQASDQWSYYQAKAMREHLYRLEKMKLEVELAEVGDTISPDAKAKAEALMSKMSEEEIRYEHEKKQIESSAKAREADRDLSGRKGPYFDYGQVLLQIAIVVASVAMLAGSAPVFAMSGLSALVGTLLTVNGFFLVVNVPYFG